jgi:hypothetical protein
MRSQSAMSSRRVMVTFFMVADRIADVDVHMCRQVTSLTGGFVAR